MTGLKPAVQPIGGPGQGPLPGRVPPPQYPWAQTLAEGHQAVGTASPAGTFECSTPRASFISPSSNSVAQRTQAPGRRAPTGPLLPLRPGVLRTGHTHTGPSGGDLSVAVCMALTQVRAARCVIRNVSATSGGPQITLSKTASNSPYFTSAVRLLFSLRRPAAASLTEMYRAAPVGGAEVRSPASHP